MKDELNITIRIASLPPIPMTVSRDDEEAIRTAQYSVNQVWEMLAGRYPGSSTEQLLALTALQFARRCIHQSAQQAAAAQAVADVDRALTRLLDINPG
ncbi:MAG: cell division protein ZapA [Candidatus Amulumruptor caecigallinarius]|nr:cell division protein ZapA [Candidatus Amulumruptor caecigallinarius]